MNGLDACERQNRTTGAGAMIAQSVADILRHHVKLAVEGIDRMYLNVFVPRLQHETGIVGFFREHRGQPLPSAALMQPMSRTFVAKLESFAAQHEIPLVQFRKGQRKDDVMKEHLRKFDKDEGVVFIGKAQEKTPVFRTEKRRNPKTGQPYPWIVRSTAMVNHYYIYALDHNFGPFFLKFCSYFPFNARLCLNGHEYAKRQLAQEGIAFAALDNGVLSCVAPARLQKICDGLSAEKIDGFLRKWLRLLPHPFTGADRKAGYRYDISILQRWHDNQKDDGSNEHASDHHRCQRALHLAADPGRDRSRQKTDTSRQRCHQHRPHPLLGGVGHCLDGTDTAHSDLVVISDDQDTVHHGDAEQGNKSNRSGNAEIEAAEIQRQNTATDRKRDAGKGHQAVTQGIEKAVKQHQNQRKADGDDDLEALLGLLQRLELSCPRDAVTARQLHVLPNSRLRLGDGAAQVAATHAELDRNETLVAFVIDV
jgi:hypothetical protein